MTPKFIIIHHSAVSREANAKQFEAIKRNHISKGWGDIGYHFLIDPNGKLNFGRKETAIGAHCSHGGMNNKSIGICLAGNFEIEKPTDHQIFMLRDALQMLSYRFKIPRARILGHKETGAATACPGKNLAMDFVRNLTILSGKE
jgi:N-acetyl-anhydromuramyl-L-alanine amidase AmpD